MSTDFAAWLHHLHILYPPAGVILVGAGADTGEWVQRLLEWNTSNATLIEADDKQFQRLKCIIPHDGWKLQRQVIANEAGSITYYQASNERESGLIKSEMLRTLWPNIRTVKEEVREAIPLANVLQDTQIPSNWLIVDCLPALPIIQSISTYDDLDVIVARVLLDDHDDIETASLTHLNRELSSCGYRMLTTQASRHPAVGQALFVRNAKYSIYNLYQLQSRLESITAELETFSQTKAAVEKNFVGSQQQSGNLRLADNIARAEDAATKKKAEELADYVKRLYEAKAAAEVLIAEALLRFNKRKINPCIKPIQKRKIFIDAGGYDGCSALVFFTMNPEFDILSFEPNPEFWPFYADLPTQLIKKAVWTFEGEIEFLIDPVDGDGSSLIKNKLIDNTGTYKNVECEQKTVPCIDLSQLIADLSKNYTEIVLKLDVEGAEYAILEKMCMDGSLEKLSKLYCEFHWDRIGITEEEHLSLLGKVEEQILVDPWDALFLSVYKKGSTAKRVRNHLIQVAHKLNSEWPL